MNPDIINIINFVRENYKYILTILLLLNLLITYFYIPKFIVKKKIKRKKIKDYRYCHGSKQIKEILNSIKKLEKEIEDHRRAISRRNYDITKITNWKDDELRKIRVRQLVNERLGYVEGIGNKLKDQIISYCFDGSLESLRKAFYRVKGIGEKKMSNIEGFISYIENTLGYELRLDFPGKKDIIETYKSKESKLQLDLKKEMRLHTDLTNFLNKVKEEIRDFKLLRKKEFISPASMDDKSYQEQILNYMNGIFSEWENEPEWHQRLLDEFSK
jgi:archaellum component FlaC